MFFMVLGNAKPSVSEGLRYFRHTYYSTIATDTLSYAQLTREFKL